MISQMNARILEDRPRRDRGVSLAGILATGLSIVCGLLISWIGSALSDHFMPPQVSETIVVDRDGQPFISRGSVNGRLHDEQFYTLERQPTDLDIRSRQLQGATFGIKPRSAESWTLAVEAGPFVTGFPDGARSPTDWYLLIDGPPRREYFVGYHRQDRRRIGYIAQNGFQTEVPSAEAMLDVPWTANGPQFLSQAGSAITEPNFAPGYKFNQPQIISRDRLLQVDFEKRTVKTLLELPGMVSFRGFQRRIKDPARLGKDENDTEYVSAVRGRDTIVILDSAGHAAERFVIPAELRDKSFDFHERPDGTALVVVTELNTHQRSQSESVIWLNRDGTIVKQMRNATEPWFYNRPTPVDRVLPGIAVPAPIVPLLAAIVTQTWADPEESQSAAIARRTVDLWPSFAIAGIAALAALWLYRKRTTQFGERRQVRWILFLALGGLPAYVAYLVHRRWPVRIACPACHVEAPRDREKCARCGRLFPAPSPNGLEIFA
jgi:hypothetical protein